MSAHALSTTEREELSALLLKIETGEISHRRVAVELLLLRKLLAEVRRINPPNLRSISSGAKQVLDRIPVASARPLWDSLAAEHFEQQPLIK